MGNNSYFYLDQLIYQIFCVSKVQTNDLRIQKQKNVSIQNYIITKFGKILTQRMYFSICKAENPVICFSPCEQNCLAAVCEHNYYDYHVSNLNM